MNLKWMAMVCMMMIFGCMNMSSPEPKTVWVDEFNLSTQSCGQGKKVQAGKSVDGHPLTVGGKVHTRGFGAIAESAVVFTSNGKVRSFDALVAIDDDAKDAKFRKNDSAKAVFRVWADGKVVAESPCITDGMKPHAIHADLTGAKEIVLETRSYYGFYAMDGSNADWLDARFECEDSAKLKLNEDPEQFVQLGILTPPEKECPQFNGADIWGVRPGHEVIFRVPVSGKRPMTFKAEGLPTGVTFDDKRGVLRGVAPAKGSYDIRVTAKNAFGEASRVIRLEVGDMIALTPPMGWNSWNCFCYRLTDDAARSAAKAMDESGFADYGWAYVNLDDWWMMNNSTNCPRRDMRAKELGHEDVLGPARDAEGRILPNRSFPDMKALTAYVHSLGLKIGIYSSPGTITCGLGEGSLNHELQDATSWVEWGFDYIKYDWCSYNYIFEERYGCEIGPTTPIEAAIQPYALMNECLRKQNRDIVYSFCQYGHSKVQEWARENGANCWRSYDDFHDSWVLMERAIESRIGGEYWKYSGPGCWVDPDMLVVGGQHSCGFDHPTFLTPNEQYTHVSVWAMVGSPLLIGCDLTKLDDFTRALLKNREVIAINQDRLGKVARRMRHTDAEDIWVRDLKGGDTAIAFVNRSPVAREMRIELSEMGLYSSRYQVRDCWRQKDESIASGFYVVQVPPHATKLARFTPVLCAKCP